MLYIIYIESKEERKIKMFEKMVNKVKNSSEVKFLRREDGLPSLFFIIQI